jgi:AraC-like DNA-binding protein
MHDLGALALRKSGTGYACTKLSQRSAGTGSFSGMQGKSGCADQVMSSRLDQVTDWKAVAVRCGFHLEKIAKALDVSERTLRRHFQASLGITAREWRDRTRLEIALTRLRAGDQLKSVSGDTKFKHRQAAAAFIKRRTGSSPKDLRDGK